MESWLNKKCFDNKCQKPVKYYCLCPGKPTFCEAHITPHFMMTKCDIKDIETERKNLLVRSAKKALDNITSKMVERAEDLIKEINRVIQLNIDYIEDIRFKIQHQDPSINLEDTINWSKNLDFETRSMHIFSSGLIYLLSVNGDSEEIEARLKKDQEFQLSEKKASEEKFKIMAEEINKLARQLSNYKKYEEDLKIKINDEFSGKLEAEFRSMNQAQQAELLEKQNYQEFKDLFVQCKFPIYKISLTNDRKFIFVCKE